MIAALLVATAFAKTSTLCGEKSAGALLDRNQKPVVTFTEELLSQANEKVKGGLQEGVTYCAVIKRGPQGQLEKILKINRRHK